MWTLATEPGQLQYPWIPTPRPRVKKKAVCKSSIFIHQCYAKINGLVLIVPAADEATYLLAKEVSPFTDKYLTTNMEKVLASVHCF